MTEKEAYETGYTDGERKSALLVKSLLRQAPDKVKAVEAVYEWIKQVLEEK